MRVGILTFPNSTSYGASLQMYALYHVIEQMGYDVEIINYFNSFMKSHAHIEKMQKYGALTRSIRLMLVHMLHCRQYMGFRKFERAMTKYPATPFSEAEKLSKLGKRYDAVICGSDQVWNPDITNFDLSYFLNFCQQETARISYAPSFGVENVSESFGEAIRRELERFSHISVREESGRRLVRELTQRDAQLVVDPTLLMDAQEWTAQETPHPAAKCDYILYYTVRSSDTLWRYCKNLAEKHNLKILRLGANIISKNRKSSDSVEYVCDVTPNEWLHLVHHARFVVTNSFHGTAFAINYRKDFYVELSSLTNSRLTHIVNTLGLEKQVVRSEEATLPISTDYAQTEKILPGMKAASLRFLKQAIKDASENNERT